MRSLATAISLAACVALAGCGSESDSPKADVSPSVSNGPTLRTVCDTAYQYVPLKVVGDWGRVVREMEFFASADDAEARNVANDIISWATPMVDFGDLSVGLTDESYKRMYEQAGMISDMRAGYRPIAEKCGWMPEYPEFKRGS